MIVMSHSLRPGNLASSFTYSLSSNRRLNKAACAYPVDSTGPKG